MGGSLGVRMGFVERDHRVATRPAAYYKNVSSIGMKIYAQLRVNLHSDLPAHYSTRNVSLWFPASLP